MPENILECREAVVDGLRSVLAEGHRYYDNSLVARYDVRTVPLKIDGKRFPDMNCTVNHARSKMSIVYPQELIGTNIGSNRGLLSVIRKYYDEYNMAGAQGDCVRYLSMNVDENIFWRVLKVTCVYFWLHFCHKHFCFRCLVHKYLSTHFCVNTLRWCTTPHMGVGGWEPSPVCRWPGGIVINGQQNVFCRCSLTTSLVRCFIFCNRTVSILLTKWNTLLPPPTFPIFDLRTLHSSDN
jgi:hypothetical protein